jgi:hypothetical protein
VMQTCFCFQVVLVSDVLQERGEGV